MSSRWRPLVIVATLLALLVFLVIRGNSPNLSLRSAMLEQLQVFELRDAELTRDAMLTRANLLANYDALMHGRTRLEDALAALTAASTAGDAEASRALAPLLQRLKDGVTTKLAKIEHFKADDALLRTSAAYLTYTISGMTLDSSTQRALSADVRDLSGTFLRLVQAPNAKTGEDFKGVLNRLGQGEQTDAELGSLIAHGSLVAHLLPQLVQQLGDIVASPTTLRSSEIRHEVERLTIEADRGAQIYRYLLFGTALVLLRYVVMQFVDLRVATARLTVSEQRLRAVAESAQDAFVSVDAEGRVASWNAAAQKIFGRAEQEAIGQPMVELVPAADAVSLHSGQPIGGTGRRPDGSEFPLEATTGHWTADGRSYVTAIIRDVTQRRQLEEVSRQQAQQLVQANKLTALGTLVSGVAHEINNPNQMVLLNASVLADVWRDACTALDHHRELEGPLSLAGLPYEEMRDAAGTLIRDVHEGARRIDRIVQDLKDFARPHSAAADVEVDMNGTVQRAVRLLSHLVHKRCERFELQLQPDLPPVLGDPQRLEQVIVNLVVNALEALPSPDRRVLVRTRREEPDRVVIDVQDEGIGIEPEHLERLCDPFFTTKQHSGGTGLGLSVTFSLLKACGGTLGFESAPGRGTTATVTLPAASVVASPE